MSAKSIAGGPLRAALVGCGEAGVQKHLRAVARLREVVFVAVADRDEALARRTAHASGIGRWHAALEPLLADDAIEAIGVVVPPGAHVDVACAAIASGKHVLIEKPIALSLDDAERIAAAAVHAPGVVSMGFHMRRHRLVRRAAAVIESGVLGEIRAVHSVWHSPRADEGLPRWRWHRETGGGALVEVAVHHFDLWRHLLGREVVNIFARSVHGTRDDETASVAALLEGGIVATGSFSERTPHAVTVTVAGDRGRLELDCLRFDGLQVVPMGSSSGATGARIAQFARSIAALPEGLPSIWRGGGDYLDSYGRQWSELASAARRGTPVGATVADGIAALRIAIAACESADRGVAVEPAAVMRAIPSRPASSG